MTAPPGTPRPPHLSYFTRITINVGDPIDLGVADGEHRRIVPILGGTVDGPHLHGRVLAAGADHQILRSATLSELDARYALQTDTGERIAVHNTGVRSGSAEDIERIVRGESVDPRRIYFRSTPRLSGVGPTWAWLGSRVFVATGERTPDTVMLHVYLVE
jgi:hypothetical protein